MKYSLQWLLQEISQGKNFDYLFFWGHTVPTNGQVGKTCLSQWYPAGFEDEAHTYYATAEHYMMAQKAILFDDLKALEAILASETPAEAKKLGRTVRNFQVSTWEQNCYEFVKKGNFLKFSQHENLRNFLLETASSVIVEASPYDKIWGIGLKQQDPRALQPTTWQGTNLLGFALMEVRDELAINL